MIQQGSEEWLKIRLGKVTASRISDVIAKTKSGWGASRGNYMAELIAERLTGTPAEKYVNGPMQWGTEREPDARAAYEFLHDATVTQVGFLPHPSIAMSGASPDGLVGDGGMVEIKCPNTATHIETIMGQAVPAKYVAQMQWQMRCADRGWCDFVSYDPRLPEAMSLFVKRVDYNYEFISETEKLVTEFLAELDAKLASLTALYERKEAA